jgi:hypothetical protein
MFFDDELDPAILDQFLRSFEPVHDPTLPRVQPPEAPQSHDPLPAESAGDYVQHEYVDAVSSGFVFAGCGSLLFVFSGSNSLIMSLGTIIDPPIARH